MENEEEDKMIGYAKEYKRKTFAYFTEHAKEELENLISSSNITTSLNSSFSTRAVRGDTTTATMWKTRSDDYAIAIDPVFVESDFRKKLPKFDKYTALDLNNTTVEQRQHIHLLFENLGGQVSAKTNWRNENTKWNFHLWVNKNNMLLSSVKHLTFVHKLKFKPYEWWLDKLNGVRIFDNSDESSKDTFLDAQLEYYAKNQKNYE